MLRKFPILLWLFSIYSGLSAQEGAAYLVLFKDKEGTPYSLAEPSAFLGTIAIDRRMRQGIEPDSLDLPVNPYFIDSLSRAGFHIHSRSRWTNSAVVFTRNPSLADWARTLSFVKEISMVRPSVIKKSISGKWDQLNIQAPNTLPLTEYGYGFTQIRQVHGDFLHSRGFRGEGIRIAVIDGGFTGADNSLLFPGAYFQATMNFLDPDSSVFGHNLHGMVVLSVMAAQQEYILTGTAPRADYMLLLSEDTETEYPVEEEYWIAAAEYADSAGADIINTSLGYTTFDNDLLNHSPGEMNGSLTRISRAASIAASRGMLLVNSAGNLGDKDWRYLSAPADAIPVLAVGAVNMSGQRAGFSSVGPDYHPSVKPDVMAMGVETAGFHPGGSVITANGTSLSAPVIAGLAACLWQAFPESTPTEIAETIRESGHRFHKPDSLYGFGIPDFELAFYLLEEKNGSIEDESPRFQVYPNPIRSEINLKMISPVQEGSSPEERVNRVRLLSPAGTPVRIWEIPYPLSCSPLVRLNVTELAEQGLFILVVETNLGNYHIKLVKIKS